MKGKNKFWYLAVVLALAAGSLALLQGCTGRVPPIGVVLTPLPPPLPVTVVDNFEDGDFLLNPRLLNSLNGFWSNTTYGQTTMSFQVTNPSPANGSTQAIHLSGTFSDPGNGSYPAFQMQAYPTNDGSLYDASSFTGIQFDWNCPASDTTVQKFFCLAVSRTTPPGQGGGCNGTPIPCYDHFSYALTNTVGWSPVTIAFASMYPQYGAYTMVPSDLQQIVFLLWTNRANNVFGSYVTDMWLDNVVFF